MTISLDAAQVAFIDFDKLVLSLKGGELYVLTLCADSMRSVRSFHFSKAASSVLTSCVSFPFDVFAFNCNIKLIFLANNLLRRIFVFGLTAWQLIAITIHGERSQHCNHYR